MENRSRLAFCEKKTAHVATEAKRKFVYLFDIIYCSSYSNLSLFVWNHTNHCV